jgi:hypothetical protein
MFTIRWAWFGGLDKFAGSQRDVWLVIIFLLKGAGLIPNPEKDQLAMVLAAQHLLST